MPKTIADRDKHRVERIVDALVERAERDVERLWQAHLVHGRPAFWVELTTEERIAEFQDDMLRQEQLKKLLDEGGGDMTKAERHYEQMVKLMEKSNGPP